MTGDEDEDLPRDANGEYDPSLDPPGRGFALTMAVLGVIALVVLVSAYRLHAFWWQ